ncbi:Hypothetical protein R9X50_00666100 [Acrodontium crateriforme]|uniref:Midasin n=1 Tax=Acrodontium crateriforme TaxID=150365 RepID=A0AAQ3RDQ4_9PEZI|nr:Hypothetical protein R9X50_00666100 [Acrodontium crateriforme]
MECRWDRSLLQRVDSLPPDLLHTIENGDNNQYLSAITRAALDPKYTYLLFAHCDDIFAHVSAELRNHGNFAASIATLGRVIQFAPHLAPYAIKMLELENYTVNGTQRLEEDLLYLLGLFRLLSFDHMAFSSFVNPAQMTALLANESRPVAYMAIRILQIYLSGADDWFEQMVGRYMGADSPESDISGPWDDQIIDYRFLTLWEEERIKRMNALKAEVTSDVRNCEGTGRLISHDCFHPSTALIGHVLLPRTNYREATLRPTNGNLVKSKSVQDNLQKMSSALKSPKPLLLTGLAGSGKTLLIRHAAEVLGKLDKMVTLHLNEQSDAKLLIGVYTTGDTPGTFLWKPGVLTTAVQEGRWVFIEDLDRAPNDIVGTLLPLIEKRVLLIPNRKQTIHAAQGFRIIATARTTVNHRGDEIRPLAHMLGARHWQHVSINIPTSLEQMHIAEQLFPTLGPLLPQLTAAYDRLQSSKMDSALAGQSKTGVARVLSPNDLLKWCRRIANLLRGRSSLTSSDVDNMFLEAVDCFGGALPDGAARKNLAAIVAEELRIDPQRRDFLLTEREVPYEVSKTKIAVGRYALPYTPTGSRQTQPQTSFSTNPHTSRMLERVAAAVVNREPLLLVGETGVGKTTAVQHLANNLGKKLEAFNLSQQSEAGDLLGGFKPVTPRSFIVPMNDEFDELFRASFSMSKNQQFLELLSKQMAKGNWKAVCKLWRQALKMVDQQRSASPGRPNKKRKVESTRAPDFVRWDTFATKTADIEKRLAGGNDAFAFSFVEGNIVKALRNGEWVLLDEINLASSDTLEAIVDLLDPSAPSLLLTEAGNIERIEAHPEFRVFAAMNPATDVGKKDLPPGVRSRFTELYVESPDKDIKSLQSIVKSYLRSEAISDQALALDVSVLYQKIVVLAEQNKLVDGAGQKPHFSLRTLTRTLSYAKHIAPQCTIRRALFEGFQMSFLTFLDIESIKLVQPLLEQHLFGKRVNVRSELRKALRKPNDGFEYVQGFPDSKHWVRHGLLQPEDESHYILTPFIKNNLENLVRAASTRKFPVLIQGPTSSGKTSMIEYLAKRTGHKFVRINNHEHTDLQEYLGTYVSTANGRLMFQEGILVKALREGHWIVLDELNLAPTDVLEALNRLLDDNRELLIPETQEVIRPHESFMLFATQNPAGLYGGRKALSRAFRNRFLELHFDDIPIDELQEILHRRTQLPESRCRRIVTIYRELSVLRQENRLFEQKSFATLRDLFRWALRPNDTIEDLAANGFMLLAERVRKPDERAALKEIIEKAMSSKGPKVTIDEDALYGVTSKEVQKYREHVENKGVVWTSAMRRLYVLVSRAIANNEPVLLVGETGCGKTTVCQMLADALGKELHTVNAHQNTETGDLIGSQRPLRNRAFIEAQLREQLLASSLLQGVAIAPTNSTDALLNAYDEALASHDGPEQQLYCESPAHQAIQANRTRFKALFEWVDGSLIQAMKEGAFFLLDEISLADDSVLERINSVLESHRSILLAEKGSLDSFVTAAPGYQFFATMNPGGDYGKRELSPALRNRFTEIWVPSLSETDDIIQIVQDKLSRDAKMYASAMVSFAKWFKEQYNTSATSSVSIRDILAWVLFINESANLEVVPAIIHGAAMVYIDTLGANPAGLMTITGRSLDQERTACVVQLGELIGIDAQSIYSAPVTVTITSEFFHIGAFGTSRASNTKPSTSSFTFDPSTSRSNAMRVLRAMQIPKAVMLEGSPGVGKTALVTAIAEAAAIPLTRINLSEQTDLLDLFGSDVPVEGAATGVFTWRDAPFLQAMKNGEWVLLDEMNLASQSVLEGLNACLDHRGEIFVPELGQTFSRHPKFRLFAAQNPHHQGGGRKGLPASFVNRFTVVYADSFRFDDLMLICERRFPQIGREKIEQAVRYVDKLEFEVVQRRSFGANGGPWEFNLRDVTRWMSLICSEHGLIKAGTARDFVEFLFSQRFRSPADTTMANNLMNCFWDVIPPSADLFSSVSTKHVQLGLAILPRNTIFAQPDVRAPWYPRSSQQLKVLQSVMLCVQNRWPVILTGPAGSGKTVLLESLARATGASLSTMAMNAETDAMDLIGGYEQADAQREVGNAVAQLQNNVHDFVKSYLAERQPHVAERLVNIMARLKETQLPSPESLEEIAEILKVEASPELENLLDTIRMSSRTIEKARFDWIDGLLVEALQRGDWLILDNANLCSSSVLDRLNSLLEPDGTLIINERTEIDGAPRVLHPHSNFRIFLTIDPRYGELSRAMRNRAAELYLPYEDAEPVLLNPLATESAMSRFRQARSFNIRPMTHDNLTQTSTIFDDHLTLSDQLLASQMYHQLETGLVGAIDADKLKSLVHVDTSLSYPPNWIENMKQLYSDLTHHIDVSADFVYAQTLHPLNNQSLIQTSQQFYMRGSLQALLYETFSSLAPIAQSLQAIGPNNAIMKRVQRAERSILAKGRGLGNGGRQNSAILAMLQYLLNATVTFVQSLLQDSQTINAGAFTELSVSMHRLHALWNYLFTAASSKDFNHAVFSAWMSTVRHTLEAMGSNPQLNLQALIANISQALEEFKSTSQSIAGRGCTSLWKALRPSLPSTLEKLESLLNFEKITDRFDEFGGRFILPLDQIVDLRLSFSRALFLAQKGTGDIQDLALRLESMVKDASVAQSQNGPTKALFFKNVFESLCRQMAVKSIYASSGSIRDIATWEILAKRPTSHTFAISSSEGEPHGHQRQLQLLNAMLPPLPSDSADEPDSETFVQSLFRRLESMEDAKIGTLNLFESESRELARAVASQAHTVCINKVSALDKCLERLLSSTLNGLASNLQDKNLQVEVSALLEAFNSKSELNQVQSLSENGTENSNSGLQWVRSQVTSIIHYLRTTTDDPKRKSEEASRAWTTYALLCLIIYLPDEPFDPALEPRMLKELHNHSVAHISSQMEEIKQLRKALTGEENSLRARLGAEELSRFGTEPSIDEVCRPLTSELPQLHGEFESLSRIVKSFDKGIDQRETWINIENIRGRLASRYRAYGDLTGPVIGFIDCLRISQWIRREVDDIDLRSSTGEIIPFVGGSLLAWSNDDAFVQALENSTGLQELLDSLLVLSARCTTLNLSQASQTLRKVVERQFFQAYQQWRIDLTEDQRKTAAKSSLYRYQGDEDTKDEDSMEYIEELFPSDEIDEDGSPMRKPTSQQKVTTLTPQIAAVHRALFQPDSSSVIWPTLLQKITTKTISNSSPGNVSNLVPKMIVSVKELLIHHAQDRKADRTYNMYTDANIGQVKALASLLHKIIRRFDSIHAAWPEHATPVDVFRLCEHIHSIGQYEPLTKILPHLEKLHATVAEWQKIASTEFSASEVYEDLTTTIVNWRQLELASWAGLLHREDLNCQRDAMSWWYIAYENIIGATHELRDSPSELQQHAENLLKTLEIFLTNCGHGEFVPRLNVLMVFRDHVAVSCADYPSLRVVYNAISNFTAYYDHFIPPITEALSKGRANLEKDIMNVVKVASWKDRNIETLRQSAKSSHKKLLRLVRKYRRLLAQPVGPVIQNGIPRKKSMEPALGITWPALDVTTQETVAQQISSWIERSDRFKNIHTTASLMQSKMKRNMTSGDTTKRLVSFAAELSSSISELQKATPATLTEKNKNLVQHLKTRKRRLLADVLKELRLMGFQSNLSDDVLSQQAALATILSHSPALENSTTPSRSKELEYQLHQLFDIMPTVRESARKHSDDLTAAETARCLALLESMLQVCVMQRSKLIAAMEWRCQLGDTIKLFTAFAEGTDLTPQLLDDFDLEKLSIQVDYLSAAITSCIDLCRIQGELIGSYNTAAIEAIQQLEQDLSKLKSALSVHSPLPSGVEYTATESHWSEFQRICNDLSTLSSAAVQTQPELSPLLGQLLKWIPQMTQAKPTLRHDQRSLNGTSWTKDLLKTLDQTLGAVQKLDEVSGTSANEESKTWLIRQQTTLDQQLAALQSSDVERSLRQLLGNIPVVHHNKDELSSLVSICGNVQPILDTFSAAYDNLVTSLCDIHAETSKLGFSLATSFVQLAQKGFCTPAEKDNSNEQSAGDVETGTGLGDGEGGEDVSKDIKDDEDLSELAQQKPETSEEKEDIEDEKDAVDMADAEMEGEMGDEAEKSENGDEGDDATKDDEMDEEAGEVDDLGSNTVDEKMWDEGKDDDLRDKETDQSKGIGQEQDMAGADQTEDNQPPEDNAGEDLDEMGAAEDEKEEVNQQEVEKMDPHVQDQDNLDLPEDFNPDGGELDDNLDIDDPEHGTLSDNDMDIDKDEPTEDTSEQGDLEHQEPEEPDIESGVENEETGENEDNLQADSEQVEEDVDDAKSDILMGEGDEADNEKKADDDVFGETGDGPNQDENRNKAPETAAQGQDGDTNEEPAETEPDSGTTGGKSKQQGEEQGAQNNSDEDSRIPYKKIGDALDEWYRQNQPIEAASQKDEVTQEKQENVDMTQAQFEHLPNDDAEADTQAIGTASADQSTALDESKGLPVNENEEDSNRAPFDEGPDETTNNEEEDQSMANQAPDTGDEFGQDNPSKAFVGTSNNDNADFDMEDSMSQLDEEEMDEVDEQLLHTHISNEATSNEMSIQEARALWAEHEASTRNSALILTEHLRLILQPTQATKMRGDFRTGKRLNIKRIIPYIASSYKRDKIWMRRSVPSKRSYQIMLAIDDSQSMAESESRNLAFETLALISKSMSMLEVGELGVIGFGEDVKVAHDFSTPFSSDTGAEVFRQFAFSQTKTNIRKLLTESIELFRAARLKATGAASELWQLQLIISDGICEDHPSVRQLVRQAHEERIMVVFIVVDSTAEPSGPAGGPKQSIIDLQSAEFVKDDNGEMQLNMVKYLDTFPFRYYLIVREVQELPAVLAGALRQWFSEVVDTAS